MAREWRLMTQEPAYILTYIAILCTPPCSLAVDCVFGQFFARDFATYTPYKTDLSIQWIFAVPMDIQMDVWSR